MADDKKWIKFDKLNQHYEDLISSGDFSGDDYDRVSSLVGQIYKIEDQSSGIYDELASDKERNTFLEDFYNVAEYLKDNPDYTDEEIAKFTIEDRKGVLPKILK